MKNSCHGSLIGGACVLTAERHERVVEVAHRCTEGSLVNVTKVHLNLVIATRSVHKREHRMSAVASTSMVMFGKGNLSFGHSC